MEGKEGEGKEVWVSFPLLKVTANYIPRGSSAAAGGSEGQFLLAAADWVMKQQAVFEKLLPVIHCDRHLAALF